MTGSCFDEADECGYSSRMRLSVLLSLSVTLSLLTCCSFSYGADPVQETPLPGLVLTNASVFRYEDMKLSVEIRAGLLELYDGDSMWAGENLFFAQYAKNSGEIDSEGKAGYMLINDREELYYLGGPLVFSLYDEGLDIVAPDIRWNRRLHHLSASRDGTVEVRTDDGSIIRGSGFFADTLSGRFAFSGGVSGILTESGREEAE